MEGKKKKEQAPQVLYCFSTRTHTANSLFNYKAAWRWTTHMSQPGRATEVKWRLKRLKGIAIKLVMCCPHLWRMGLYFLVLWENCLWFQAPQLCSTTHSFKAIFSTKRFSTAVWHCAFRTRAMCDWTQTATWFPSRRLKRANGLRHKITHHP